MQLGLASSCKNILQIYWQKCPLTLLITIVSILVRLCMFFFSLEVIKWLIFVDIDIMAVWFRWHNVTENDQLITLFRVWWQSFSSGQYWRVISPIFLHFSFMHIAFNLAMFWFFGYRIEIFHGTKKLLILVTLVAISSNFMQYLLEGLQSVVFGGLSGVVYGLIGFCLVLRKQIPYEYGIPVGIYGFSIIWLVIGFTGMFDNFLGKIANISHLVGFITGIIIGYLQKYWFLVSLRWKR